MNDVERLIFDLGTSPAELARRLGVSEASVSRWRSGTHSPSGLYAQRIAEMQALVALRRGRTARGGDLEVLVARLLDAAAPAPEATADDYTRGYQQGYRDACAALLGGVAQRGLPTRDPFHPQPPIKEGAHDGDPEQHRAHR